jgi:hypothetical protein
MGCNGDKDRPSGVYRLFIRLKQTYEIEPVGATTSRRNAILGGQNHLTWLHLPSGVVDVGFYTYFRRLGGPGGLAN